MCFGWGGVFREGEDVEGEGRRWERQRGEEQEVKEAGGKKVVKERREQNKRDVLVMSVKEVRET